jgi:hypothetical protein
MKYWAVGKKLHNEELHSLRPVPKIIRITESRRMRWAEHAERMGLEEECIQGFGGKARRKETTRKTKRRWENNIKMDLREIGGGGMDWIDLAQDRDEWRALASTVRNLQVP